MMGKYETSNMHTVTHRCVYDTHTYVIAWYRLCSVCSKKQQVHAYVIACVASSFGPIRPRRDSLVR